MKVVFMGTPGFAATVLGAIIEAGSHEIVGVYTQPDRPCGRGQVCKPSEVKQLALEHDLDVYQPENFKNDADVEQLATLNADVAVVAAYGLILPQRVLDTPRLGCINVHASLLPRYRGAAPIQRAIMNGDPVTGITIMQMEAGLDSGPILLQRALGIGINDAADLIHDELADLGGRLMVEALARLEAGGLMALPQDESRSTHAPKLTKAEGAVDWNRDAQEVHNQIRGLHPWPGTYFEWTRPDTGKKMRLCLEPGEVGPALEDITGGPFEPGAFVVEQEGRIGIACADKLYWLPCVRPQGKKSLDGRAFACGYLKDILSDDVVCPAPAELLEGVEEDGEVDAEKGPEEANTAG